MRVLHHYQLSASARFIRLVLAERDLVFLPKIEIPWERNEAFLSLNPAGDVPVLVAENGLIVSGGTVIAEYIGIKWGIVLVVHENSRMDIYLNDGVMTHGSRCDDYEVISEHR